MNEPKLESIKTYKLINSLTKNTSDGKMTWKLVKSDKINNIMIFSSEYKITENKKLSFVLKSTDNRMYIDDNVLRVVYKANNNTELIAIISLKQYSNLIVLIKYLYSLLLDLKFNNPYSYENIIKNDDSKTEIDDYKKVIKRKIIGIMNTFSTHNFNSDFFNELNDLYEECNNADDKNSLDQIAYKAELVLAKKRYGYN